MDQIRNMKVFLRVIDGKSFSKAAREMNLGQPTVSKIINAFEDELGFELLNRSTKGLSLTEEGEKVYLKCQEVLERYEELLLINPQRSSAPKGVINVSCPISLGHLHIVPKLGKFYERYPDLKIDLKMSDSFDDLLFEGIDVAIRIGKLKDSRLIAKKIGYLRRITLASKNYLNTNPAPESPKDLEYHNCIVHKKSLPQGEWAFRRKNSVTKVRVTGNLIVDNFTALRSAVLADIGVANVGRLLIDEKTLPKLEILLPEYESPPSPINILYLQGKHIPPRIRAFIDFIYEGLVKETWITHSQ